MVRVAFVFTLAGLAGCRDDTIQHLKEVRDQVCACTTAACGEQAMTRLPQSDVKPDHRAQGLANEMLNCMAKLYLRERPSLDPDRPADSDQPARP